MKHHAIATKICLDCGSHRVVTFGSRTEARYYFRELLPAEQEGRIRGIEIHPVFKLPGGVKVVADFSYEQYEQMGLADAWIPTVVDVKGRGKPLTQSFRRNQKLVRAIHGIVIEVVYR